MTSTRSPNILLIVADDLGFSDLGCFGGEIQTPHLDALARRGVRLTNFHASPVCSTTRAMLMTGCDHHEVGFGNLAEFMQPAQIGKPGYEGFLTDRAATIAERMQDAGYLTLFSGKWHLGRTATSRPSKKGFERSYALFQGEHNHFGHDQTPETAGFLGVSNYELDGEETQYPLGSYSSDRFADQLIDFMRDAADDPRPQFSYLAFTAPHSPIQAPQQLVAKYRGCYDAGPEDLKVQRLARMKARGLSVGNIRSAPIQGGTAWMDLPPEQRALESRKMEVYAAMVEAMDTAIGRVIHCLEETGRLADTQIIFLSDNGPAGTLREEAPGSREWIQRNADNTLDNVGNASSYVSIGPSWAQAQSAPFFLFKRYTTEGGVRTCAIACGPGVQQRSECTSFVHAMDIAPTFLDLAGAFSAAPEGKIPMRGLSSLPTLRNAPDSDKDTDRPVCWELGYGRAAKIGQWKAVYLPMAVRTTVCQELPAKQWLLFDIEADPGETNNIAAQQPEKLAKAMDAWFTYAAETGVIFGGLEGGLGYSAKLIGHS